MSSRVARLTSCSDFEYAEFASLQVIEYARPLVRAGEVAPEHSVATARERLDDLLADRLRRADHDFFIARSAASAFRVGWIWSSPAPDLLNSEGGRRRWLSRLTVDEPHRGQGWGRALLIALENHEVTRGTDEIWLRVFNWNAAARRLYDSHGYEVATQFATDAHLRKRLSAGCS